MAARGRLHLGQRQRPGTYLYQSGTQPQVQVQMGLYGAVTKNAADATRDATARAQAYAGAAYRTTTRPRCCTARSIRPCTRPSANGSLRHAAGPTSTFDYAPKYFLINGQPYPFGTPVIAPRGNPGTTLLRLLNAGLTTHVPMIQGAHWTLVAEDGKPYPYRAHPVHRAAAGGQDGGCAADAGQRRR